MSLSFSCLRVKGRLSGGGGIVSHSEIGSPSVAAVPKSATSLPRRRAGAGQEICSRLERSERAIKSIVSSHKDPVMECTCTSLPCICAMIAGRRRRRRCTKCA